MHKAASCTHSTRKPLLTGLFFLLVSLFSLQIAAQNRPVTGTVVDVTGEAVIGASVVEDGTTNGIITDMDGNFTLNLSPTAKITISFIGYQTQKVDVEGRSSLRIVLKDDSKVLDEVVVVGYGTARKSDVTGSISSVNDKTLREVPSQNFTQALQGRVAGVDINRTSSRPGAEQQIRIRGTRSLSASNDPLIVLDGIPFPGSISDINPSDIKSIDILKDASSTAIYGSRGANGVILITTNRGAQGKPTITYNGYYGIVTLFSEYPMFNGPEFVKFREVAAANGSAWGQAGPMDDPNVNTNWQDLVFKNGMTTNHDISVSAGTDRGSYNFGTTYYKETAVLPDQGFERMSLRGAIDQEVGRFIKVGITTQNSYSKTEGEQAAPIYNLLQTNPTISPYASDGTMNEVLTLNTSDKLMNPLLYKSTGSKYADNRKTFASYNNAYAEVKFPVEGLKYRINLGLNYRQSNYGKYMSPGTPHMGYNADLAEASISNGMTTNWTVENLLMYDNSFGKHNINAVAMYSAERTTYEYSSAGASGITADAVKYYNLALNTDKYTINPNSQKYWQRGLISYMARAAYSYDNRYMLSATVRTDGSSVLAKGKRWNTYPAVSAGWNVRNEAFMEDVDWVSSLKVRVGYGETSNQSINPYATLGAMQPVYYTLGGGAGITGYFPSSVPNEKLGWEYSTTWNYGIDFGFFDGRLSGTFEYYSQKTNDILMQLSLPASSGIASSYWQNIGKTSNKGWEVSLKGIIFENKNGWSWDLGLNLYGNRNKITSLAGEQDRDTGNGWFVGKAIDAIYDYKKIGIYQLGEEAIAAAAITNGKPGDIKVAYNLKDGDPVTFDANGVPSRELNASDRMVIGTAEGKFQGGFNTTVAYKDFDLSIVGAFKNGGTLISTLHQPQGYLNMMSGRRGNIKVDYWTKDNPTNKYPAPGGTSGGNDAPIYGSTLGYFSASYLKIRTITLGYNLPDKLLSNLGLGRARIYFTAQNPFVFFSSFEDETGLDPEPNSFIRENTATEGGMPSRLLSVGTNTPSTRNYIFGLNITF